MYALGEDVFCKLYILFEKNSNKNSFSMQNLYHTGVAVTLGHRLPPQPQKQ